MRWAIWLCLAMTMPLAAQQRLREPLQTGLIGRVTAADGRPLAGVLLTLDEFGEARVHEWTGLDGGYRFRKLKPGSYSIRATKSGYASDSGPAVVSPGKITEAPVLLLQRRGVIAGVVSTPEGLPMAGADVRLWRSVWHRGRSRLIPSRSDSTDDLGRYRIIELAANEYIVSLAPAGKPAADGRVELLSAPRLYPTVGAGEIGAIRLGQGEILDGVDFRGIEPANTRLIGSIVLDPDDTPCTTCAVEISHHTPAGLLPILQINADAGGTFAVAGLEPGLYQAAVLGSSASREPYAAIEDVAIERDRTTRASVRARRGISAVGTVRLINPPAEFVNEDGSWKAGVSMVMNRLDPPLFRPWRAHLVAEGSGSEGPLRSAQPLAPGDYYLPRLNARRHGAYVRSVAVDGRPIRETRIRLPTHAQHVRLDFEIAFDVSVVEGRVDLPGGMDASQAVVRLEPLDLTSAAGAYSRVSDGGRYRVENVAPGRYWAHATVLGRTLDAGDPAARARYAGFGLEIEVKGAETVTAELRLIE